MKSRPSGCLRRQSASHGQHSYCDRGPRGGAGQFTGVTPCGTALTSERVAALARVVNLPDRGLRVALDADDVSRGTAVRAYARLAPVTGNLTAVILPDGHDPAEILEKNGRKALSEILASQVRPLTDLVVDARIEEWAHGQELKFAENQIGALRAAAKVIAAMHEDQVGRLTALYTDRYGWHPEEVRCPSPPATRQRCQAAVRSAHRFRGQANETEDGGTVRGCLSG